MRFLVFWRAQQARIFQAARNALLDHTVQPLVSVLRQDFVLLVSEPVCFHFNARNAMSVTSIQVTSALLAAL